MKRNILALCAAMLMAGFGLGVSPASAYVGDYDYSFNARGGDRAASSSRADRRSVRSNRGARAHRATRQRSAASTESRQTRRAANRGPVLSSLTRSSGGSGMASYYWQPQRLASGGMFNPNAMTAAHKTLPFGTRVRVTNLNNRSCCYGDDQ